MSAYKNFVQDFPLRCLDVLELARPSAGLKQREVTLALMVASAGLVIPYERLASKKAHVSGDPQTFADASSKLTSLLEGRFLTSPLAANTISWCAGKLKTITGDPDSWPELSPTKPMTVEKFTGTVVSAIRNALAHGSIYTLGNRIESIIFISKRDVFDKDGIKTRDDFSYILVSPVDFLTFLKNWFSFIEALNLDLNDINKVMNDNAKFEVANP